MNPKKLINAIKEKCQEVPERAPGYRAALLDTVSDIVWEEHKHAIRATTIQKTVTDCCEALGDYIPRNSREESG